MRRSIALDIPAFIAVMIIIVLMVTSFDATTRLGISGVNLRRCIGRLYLPSRGRAYHLPRSFKMCMQKLGSGNLSSFDFFWLGAGKSVPDTLQRKKFVLYPKLIETYREVL